MFAKYEAFNNDENSGKFTNRMLALIGMHDFISNAGEKSEYERGYITSGLLQVESELCFLLSLLTSKELEEFYKKVKINWSDNVGFEGNRPTMKKPKIYEDFRIDEFE
ncbi:hypothetical protein [Bacillus cereus]|uniref:hypothetical protein n=1 Tax=Bacillus cereus TaxID=1396 RepID=UPI000BECD18B|nr:hypothetical protein [Bacillus cereus]PDY56971.1 hypothetical protein COM88_31220 [Bacillus cereus]PGQ47073.1 hypothetical protein COA26_33135 [Bacillus cereus]